MKTQNELHLLVSRLIISSLPVAVCNKSFIVNNVPEKLWINADAHMIASVIGALLNAVTSCAKDSCICISAKIYGNVILLHVRDNNSSNSVAIANGLQQVQPLAEKTGGHVSITSKIKKMVTIAYSFPNLPIAA